MKAVLVKWIDAVESPGWQMVNELTTCEAKQVNTLGWLVEETDVDIIVASSLVLAPAQICATLIIPRICITSIKAIEMDMVEK